MSSGRCKRQRLVFSEKLMYSFIKDYRDNACLWDIKIPEYKSVEKRRSSLAKLSLKYNISEEEVKRKINSLRSTYLQEKKKVEESKKVEGGEVYEPTLYWYHELEFLYDVIIPRKTSPHFRTRSYAHESCHTAQFEQDFSNADQEVGQEHLIFELVADDSEKMVYSQKHEPSSSYISQPNVHSGNNFKKFVIKKPSVTSGFQPQTLLEHVDVHRVPSNDRSESPPSTSYAHQEDEFSIFCSSIASQLRTLPSADAIEMQFEIQQLVSRRRLAVLKNQQNLLFFRTWEEDENDPQYHLQHSPLGNYGNGHDIKQTKSKKKSEC